MTIKTGSGTTLETRFATYYNVTAPVKKLHGEKHHTRTENNKNRRRLPLSKDEEADQCDRKADNINVLPKRAFPVPQHKFEDRNRSGSDHRDNHGAHGFQNRLHRIAVSIFDIKPARGLTR